MAWQPARVSTPPTCSLGVLGTIAQASRPHGTNPSDANETWATGATAVNDGVKGGEIPTTARGTYAESELHHAMRPRTQPIPMGVGSRQDGVHRAEEKKSAFTAPLR